MKSRLLILGLFIFCSQAGAADVLLINDPMSMPLRRSWTLTEKSSTVPWEVKQSVVINADRLQIRFGKNSSPVQKFEITDATSGTTLFKCSSPVKKLYFPSVKKHGRYTIKMSGTPSAQAVHAFVESLPSGKGALFTPNWNNNPSTTVEDASPNGINLVTSGKLNFIQTSLYNRLKAGQNYRMEFEVATFEEQKISIRARWGRGSGNFGNREFTLSPLEKSRIVSMDFTPKSSDAVSLTLYCESKLQIRRFRLFSAAPDAAVRSRMIGGNKAYFEHRNPSPEPENPGLKVPVFFRRPPRMIYFDSIPQPHEIVKKLDTFTAQGEYAVWHFAVHDPHGTNRIGKAEVSALKCGNNIIPAEKIALNFVECQDYPMSASNFMNIPERILPMEMCPPGKSNRIFWFQTRIAPDAEPGVYSGECTVECSGEKLKIPLRVRVLPFKLKKPSGVHWTMYTNLFHGQKLRYSRAAHKRYLQDMKDYGIESMQVMAASEQKIKYIQELRREIGMTGPLVLAGLALESRIPKSLGYKKTAQRLVVQKDGKQGYWYEFPDIREEFVRKMKQVDSWVRKYGGTGFDRWYYEGHDEPHLYKDRWASAIWQCKLAKLANVKTASCTYPVTALDEIGPWLDVSTNMLIGSEADLNRRMQKTGRKHNITFVYLGAGCYRGQEGGLMPNRLTAGLRMFKLGLKGHSSYTYMEPDFPVDHFLRGKRYHMAYPVSKRPDGKGRVVYSTLQLEGLREGITDYKYLCTLEKAIVEAEKSGKSVQAAAAREVLKQILADVPFSRESGSSGDGISAKQHFNNDTAEHIRMLVAAEILKLQSK